MSNTDEEFEKWKREVLDAMTHEERRQLAEDQLEYQRSQRVKKYHEYLDSDQWKLIRRLKLEEADYKCEVCSGDKYLQVHHRDYRNLFKERMKDLTVLCETCHKLYETNKRMQKLSA